MIPCSSCHIPTMLKRVLDNLDKGTTKVSHIIEHLQEENTNWNHLIDLCKELEEYGSCVEGLAEDIKLNIETRYQ